MRIQLIAALTALMISSGAARAAAVMDVNNLLAPPTPPTMGASGFSAGSTISPTFSGDGVASQTWTVGVTGNLAEIDLYDEAFSNESLDGVSDFFNPAFDVTLSVFSGGSAFVPGTHLLASVTRSSADIGVTESVTAFDFDGLGVHAHAGEVLTFQMSVAHCPEVAYCTFGWADMNFLNGIGSTYGYSGGSAFTRTKFGGFTWPDQDMNFRTWMIGTPEPMTWVFLAAGFGMAGASMRRRRSAHARCA